MKPNRRGFMFATGGAAAAAMGWWFGASTTGTPTPVLDPAPRGTEAYVDVDGWIVSAEDKRKLASERGARAEDSD